MPQPEPTDIGAPSPDRDTTASESVRTTEGGA
jgi:hypothetical protein